MKHISVLVPEGGSLASIECPRFVFTEVNKFLERQGRPAMFTVELLGLGSSVTLNGGLYAVQTKPLAAVTQTDLVVVPALEDDMERYLEANQGFQDWIVQQYKAGAEVASLCVGAFLLASTGLLIGKKCATHWMGANNFRRMFPDVNLVEDKIITDEFGIYSSGGGLSFMNLIIYIVEKIRRSPGSGFLRQILSDRFRSRQPVAFHYFPGTKRPRR